MRSTKSLRQSDPCYFGSFAQFLLVSSSEFVFVKTCQRTFASKEAIIAGFEPAKASSQAILNLAYFITLSPKIKYFVYQKTLTKQGFYVEHFCRCLYLCAGEDLNLHALRHQFLRLAWLPITPPAHQ